jgi:predicted dienelactone hydrolase
MMLSACGSDPRTTAGYVAAGSHGIGLRNFTFVDSSRPTMANHDYSGAPTRTLPVDVWYPSATAGGPTRDDAVAPGRWPLVIHSHGFMDNRKGEGYLGEHLASWGYVVAALDYPLSNGGAPGGPTVRDTPNQPGDLSFVIDSLLADPTLGPAIDPARIGASGLSLGGLTTLLATFHPRFRDARIKAALAMAPPACMLTSAFYQTAKVPLMLVHGDDDVLVVPTENSVRAFERAQDPRELVLLKRGSHTGFSGYASLFDQTMHFDRIGCTAIAGSVDVTSFDGLGTEAEGISADPSVCPAPCTQPPTDPPLGADRQHDLTQAIALAFFDGWLHGDHASLKWVEGALAHEKDVTVRMK